MTLKEARLANHLRTEDVAKYLGISTLTISSWEFGRTAPTIDDFVKLLELYCVKFDEIDLPIKRKLNQ